MPTLKVLARQNPRLMALSNASANFDTREPLERAGFSNIQPLIERQPYRLAENFEVTRFPTTGIDNFLVIRAGKWTILNYNDCNVPAQALKKLLRRIGPIDILMNNFNHAGKLLDSEQPPEEILQERKEAFQKLVSVVQPCYVIPFASMHYYRAPYSQQQNLSMLSGQQIAESIPNALFVGFGDTVQWNSHGAPQIERLIPPLRPQPKNQQSYQSGSSWDDLLKQADRFCQLIRKEFFCLTFWISPLQIQVEDLNKRLVLDFNQGVREGSSEIPPHITSHSDPLFHWFSYKYGTVDFHVGAHYRIETEDKRSLIYTMLAGGLVENALSPRSLLKLLSQPKGWQFLWNRREEIIAILLGRKFDITSRL